MPVLQRLRADHADALLRFELDNRAYFAASISDRGEDWFAHFAERFDELLVDQRTGVGAYRVLVDEDGSVLGRFNLRFVDGDCAEVGCRVAEAAAGRGLATTWVGELCELAANEHGLRRVIAAASQDNAASRRMLVKAGFTLIGPAEPADIGGKPGDWYERLLTRE